MIDFPSVTLAFMAGIFTVFSPCSFPLLPGYFIYRLTVSSSRRNTILAGVICALGLISVFCALAIVLSFAGAILSSYVTVLPLVAGIVMIAMGGLMLAGQRLSHTPILTRLGKGHDTLGTFGYGIAYGLASTACSAPVFYSLVLYSLASRSVGEGATVFTAYSLGIALPLVIVSALVGFGRGALVQKFSKTTPMIHRISGVLLTAFGLYQVYRYLTT